jgi:anti-sigma regulatory factor (Ser/Thr protein kinase)
VLTLGSDLAELGRLAGETDAFCDRQGVPDAARMALQLALEEIVTNIVSHGGADAAPIEVSLHREGDSIEARVEDHGTAFDPLTHEDPDVDAPLEERPEGGLGILLVKRVMDEVKYERAGARNVLTIRKDAAAVN